MSAYVLHYTDLCYYYGMNIFHTIILSLIEGITEFLPVSSTGHLILASKLLGIPATEFTKSFDIFIQLGAIMAVVSLYFRRILSEPKIIKPVLIAFIPTGILGLLLYKTIKAHLLNNDMVVVAALAGVGLILIGLEWYWKMHPQKHTATLTTLSVKTLITIGLSQSISMMPGVSRAGATIVGGMLSGLSRKDAVELSFLLAVPTMAAATGLDLVKNAHAFTSTEIGILATGFVLSWITAIVVIKGFMRFVTTSTFTGFGVYRIIIAAVYWMIISL